MSEHQKTIEKEALIEGAGIHTGKKCAVKFLPAPAGHGVVFVRVDLPQRPAINARLANLLPTRRRTTLASAGARVETVEHLLASMLVLGIDNCLIEINSVELPALDGSALPYYNLLRSSGVRELDAPPKEVCVTRPVEVRVAGGHSSTFYSLKESRKEKGEQPPSAAGEQPPSAAGDAFIRAVPAQQLSVSYRLSYPQVGVEEKVEFTLDQETFAREIAPARTFCLEEEVKPLLEKGFGKGATPQNTVVLGVGGPKGKLRFADEPARHKVLDLLGDLFFLGGRLRAHFECQKSGHAVNRMLLEALGGTVDSFG